MALMLTIGFHCYLRTGEMFSFKVSDVVFDNNFETAVLMFGPTKTSVRRAGDEAVTAEDPFVCKCLRLLTLHKMPGDKLLNMQQPRFRYLFKQIVKAWDLEDFNYLPYSLRRGGATADFRLHGNIERCIVRGRWASSKTARIYIEDSLAQLAKIALDDETRSAMIRATRYFVEQVNSAYGTAFCQ